ncbi:MAG: hypothetical protein JKY56_27575 [Kofleriaceae bacterium]|nr:hypothetical protein [Kofleriaceae bacterium]
MKLKRHYLQLVTSVTLASAVACSSPVGSGQNPDAASLGPDAASLGPDAASSLLDAAFSLPDASNRQNPMGVDPNLQDDGSSFTLLHDGRTKEEFVEDNWVELQRMVIRVNSTLDSIYSSTRLLTTADVVLALYAEMAIHGDGTVDIFATHSEGERGLVPLPSNISYWIGNSAPPWDSLHSIEDNIFSFAYYLGQIKNKEVGESAGRTLYGDLFLFPGVADQFLPEARVAAGVLHGYFYSGAYIDGATIPFDAILQGLSNGDSLPSILQGTGYKNATPERIYILEGRQRNLDAASLLWTRLLFP